jgi:cell division protein FtsN
MTKDYRRNPAPKRRRDARRGSCAVWFLFGGLIGAFGVGYAWMIHEPEGSGQISERATTRPPPEPAQERTFDFYSLLPEEEVVVPAQGSAEPPALPPAAPAANPESAGPTSQDTAAPAPKPTETATAAPAKPKEAAPSAGSGYLLQVGSFRSPEDAERLKAKLALLDVQTNIQTVTIDSGQTYHRVRTGTYAKVQAQSLSNRLEREGHESIMIRAR